VYESKIVGAGIFPATSPFSKHILSFALKLIV
jgi:hypothetical protein